MTCKPVMALLSKKSIFTLGLVLCVLWSPAQEVTVYRSGEEGYASYRIPAIIKNKSGDLIALAEGRVDGSADFGNVDIVCKISRDHGKSWSPLKVVVDNGELQAGNPAPVVDLLDDRYPKGRVFLFYNTGNQSEQDVRNGKGLREVWYITSEDGGQSWSSPVNITSQVHRPYQPLADSSYQFTEDWRTYANTPGHAFQFVYGRHKGRIYVAANHNQGNPQPGNTDWVAHAYFTDDHGETFRLSENVDYAGSNESTAAQIGDNRVYMSSRNQSYHPRQRIISISQDGGESWQFSRPDPNLPDPVNQGSVLSWKAGNTFILAHSNAADSLARNRLTLRLSRNGGESWYYNKVVAHAPAGYQGAFSAYSDIVLISEKKIGILYEKNNYREIVFLTEEIE